MREFTDRLCDTYKNGTAEQKQRIDDVTKNAVKIHKEKPLYDIGRYLLNHDYQVDYSVLLAIKGVYQKTIWKYGEKSMILSKLTNYHPDGKQKG